MVRMPAAAVTPVPLLTLQRRSFVSPTPPQAVLLFTTQRLLYNLSQVRWAAAQQLCNAADLAYAHRMRKWLPPMRRRNLTSLSRLSNRFTVIRRTR